MILSPLFSFTFIAAGSSSAAARGGSARKATAASDADSKTRLVADMLEFLLSDTRVSLSFAITSWAPSLSGRGPLLLRLYFPDREGAHDAADIALAILDRHGQLGPG